MAGGIPEGDIGAVFGTPEPDPFTLHCTGPIERFDRKPHEDGGEWVTFHFEAGGSVAVYTRHPLVWVAGRDEKAVN